MYSVILKHILNIIFILLQNFGSCFHPKENVDVFILAAFDLVRFQFVFCGLVVSVSVQFSKFCRAIPWRRDSFSTNGAGTVGHHM